MGGGDRRQRGRLIGVSDITLIGQNRNSRHRLPTTRPPSDGANFS
jgi:hypothetical protein